MDLALIVPLAFLSAILLWRRSAWGYLLASVAVMKFLMMGLAVSTMGINMWRMGVATSPVELAVFPILTLVNAVLAVLLLRNVWRRRKHHVGLDHRTSCQRLLTKELIVTNYVQK